MVMIVREEISGKAQYPHEILKLMKLLLQGPKINDQITFKMTLKRLKVTSFKLSFEIETDEFDFNLKEYELNKAMVNVYIYIYI